MIFGGTKQSLFSLVGANNSERHMSLCVCAVTCVAGSYYDNNTETCALCAIGTFQPLSGQTNCISCTPGTTTQTVGSINSNQCKSEWTL